MLNKVILHFSDGKFIKKGETNDFSPSREFFHFKDKESGENSVVYVSPLKAIFFVKSFEGNKDYKERMDIERKGLGKKIQVQFKDGETIIGYTTGYNPGRPAFFLFPCDPHSNNDRIFVLNESTSNIKFL